MSSKDRASWSLNNPDYTGWNFTESVMYRANLYWDVNSLSWVKATGGAIPGANVNVTNFPAVQPVSATSWPLPTGASTEATLATRVADATITARLNTLGQKTMAASAPVVLASDYVPVLQQDLIGNANNYYPNKEFSNIIGRNSVVNNTQVDLWEGGGVYVFPTVAQQMQIVSTSANDSSAGSGVRTITIHALDVNYNPVDILVTLNGTTPVLTVATNILRINGAHAQSIGAVNGSAAGNISIANIGATITYGIILAGSNTAHQAIFTVPAGKTGYLNHWQASSGTTTGTHFTRITIRATQHYGTLIPGVFLAIDEQGTLNGGIAVNYLIPIKFPATCDVKMAATSDAANASAVVNGAMFGWIE